MRVILIQTTTLLFTIASKKIKYLGINLTKEVKDLYNEKFKHLRKEITSLEHEQHLMFMDGRINIVEMTVYTKSYLQT